MISGDYSRAYTAYLKMRLRILEDEWIWDDTKFERAIGDLKEQLESMDAKVWCSCIPGGVSNIVSVRWKINGKYREVTTDSAGADSLIARWRAGEFNND